jgi:hypothetical protein
MDDDKWEWWEAWLFRACCVFLGLVMAGVVVLLFFGIAALSS